MLFAQTELPQGTLVVLTGAICTILTIIARDGGPWIYKILKDRGQSESVLQKIKREGQDSVIAWLEKRVVDLEKKDHAKEEEICQLQDEHRDCLIKTATLNSELNFAKEKIAALEAWKARRGGSDVIKNISSSSSPTLSDSGPIV